MASAADRPPTENQLSSLPGPKVLITSHNDEGKAIVKETEPVKVRCWPAYCHIYIWSTHTNTHNSHQWTRFADDTLGMSVLWTTQFPTDLNNEADIKQQ